MTIIAVLTRNNAIGRDNDLLFHLPADLRHFKALTLDGAVIMGRRTWESLPKRPLPKRLNIVISSREDYEAPGALVAHSLEEAMALVPQGRPCFVIGGGSIYKQALPLADTLEITMIDAVVEDADTFFPPIPPEQWREERASPPLTENGLTFRFITLARKGI